MVGVFGILLIVKGRASRTRQPALSRRLVRTIQVFLTTVLVFFALMASASLIDLSDAVSPANRLESPKADAVSAARLAISQLWICSIVAAFLAEASILPIRKVDKETSEF